MKKIIYTLIAIGFTFWGSAQNIDVNFRVTSRTATQLTVALEARSLPASTTVGRTAGTNGGFSQVFTYNSAALGFSSITLNAGFGAGWGNNSTGATAGTVTSAAQTTNASATNFTITTTYTVLATIVFNITTDNQALNFEFGASNFNQGATTRNVVNKFDKVTFNGTTWVGGNGTAGAPAAGVADLCKDIAVTSGAAEIVGAVQCDYVVISGGTLTVKPGASIAAWTQTAGSYTTTAASFILDADNTGYGQFLGAPVALTARQYWNVASARWINIGFPVSGNLSLGGAPIRANGGTTARCVIDNGPSNTVATTNVYEFTSGDNNCSPTSAQVEHEWSGLTGLPSAGANGYNIYIGGTSVLASTGIISATGTSVNSASYNYTHFTPHAGGTGSQSSDPANYDGWRLLANPFTCNLDVTAFLASNAGVMSISIGSGSYSTLSSGTIAPFQGFWIKTGSDGHSQTINFTAAHRVIGTAGVTKTNTLGDHVALHVTFGNNVSEAQLVFDPNTTKGYDQMYDGFCFINRGANTPNIAFHYEYTATPGNYTVWSPMHMNTVPEPVNTESYQLLFANTTAGSHTMAIDASVLPIGYSVYVEDLLLAPGTLHNITNAGYTFNHSGANADPLRFVLHVSVSGIGIEEANIANMGVWFAGSELQFSQQELIENATIQVFSINGQLVAQGTTQAPIYIHQTGVYIVKINTKDGHTHNVKVVKM